MEQGDIQVLSEQIAKNIQNNNMDNIDITESIENSKMSENEQLEQLKIFEQNKINLENINELEQLKHIKQLEHIKQAEQMNNLQELKQLDKNFKKENFKTKTYLEKLKDFNINTYIKNILVIVILYTCINLESIKSIVIEKIPLNFIKENPLVQNILLGLILGILSSIINKFI
tara:strand:+ start:3587 stop:4105 length:519 start_codon:yes stop_codon:yes gene_type:complete